MSKQDKALAFMCILPVAAWTWAIGTWREGVVRKGFREVTREDNPIEFTLTVLGAVLVGAGILAVVGLFLVGVLPVEV